MNNSTKILGALAAGATIMFLWKSSKEKGSSMNHIEGLNINLNPEKLVRSGIELMPIDPTLKGHVRTIASNIVGGYMEEE